MTRHEDEAEPVRPEWTRRYLERRHWRYLERKDEQEWVASRLGRIYRNPRTRQNTLWPADSQAGDYRARVHEMAREVAASEGRPETEVMADFRHGGEATVRIELPGRSGDMSLEELRRWLGAAQMLVEAARADAMAQQTRTFGEDWARVAGNELEHGRITIRMADAEGCTAAAASTKLIDALEAVRGHGEEDTEPQSFRMIGYMSGIRILTGDGQPVRITVEGPLACDELPGPWTAMMALANDGGISD